MISIKADFHIHSTLSPCADLSMSPRAIVSRAASIGFNVIAVSDHNCALHVPLVSALCEKAGIYCVPAMEVCSSEEIHLLCLFPSIEAVLALNELVFAHLPDLPKKAQTCQEQVEVNENDEVVRFVTKNLALATSLGIDDICRWVYERGGIVVPSHVDRPYFSIISQLGFIPTGSFKTVEIYRSSRIPDDLARSGMRIISNSDAHYLEDIGSVFNECTVDELSWKSIKAVLEAGPITIRVQRK